ncbi:MAG: sugar isomerase [Candidatus Hydrogenedentes bacterium]|nr:sugar isomerase [Candidatus Hydrogenedentota bacterium]
MCCHCMTRREFIGASGTIVAGAALLSQMSVFGAGPGWNEDFWDPQRPLKLATRPIRVQPILMYRVPVRREQSSFKSWGGVQSDAAAEEEAERIMGELEALVKAADFPMEVLPVLKVTTEEQAAQVAEMDHEVSIVYPATGSGTILKACMAKPHTIVFVRRASGPMYYWYEALSTRYLRPEGVVASAADERLHSVHDVVVDDPEEVLWRLRAFAGLHNFVSAKIVAVGGPMGKYDGTAPEVARERYGMEIVDVGYDDLGPRIQAALADTSRMALAERWTDTYLALPGTTMGTERSFVTNSFILYGVFKELLEEHGTPLFTIKECMSTIIPMSNTTACLTLSLLNDEGYGAFCESDFVVIPPGVLLYSIARKPVFMHNSTFPHKGLVTCAHCTGPRRMDGSRYEPALITRHYESEYGAAPKVEMPLGQELTFIDPEYANPRWVGMKGNVEANPAYEACVSQQDVRIQGRWQQLLSEVRDSHWVMAYGDYLKEAGYAARHLGVAFEDLST